MLQIQQCLHFTIRNSVSNEIKIIKYSQHRQLYFFLNIYFIFQGLLSYGDEAPLSDLSGVTLATKNK